MGVIEDIRKVVQDLVAPDLKALQAQLKAVDDGSKLRDETLLTQLRAVDESSKLRDEALLSQLRAVDEGSKLRDASLLDHIERLASESRLRDETLLQRMELKFESTNAKIDANHATLMNALNIDKRVEAIERKNAATM